MARVTRRQMHAARLRHPDRRIVLRCQCGTTSADPDDYFYWGMDDPWENCAQCDRPFALGYERSEWVPV